MPAWLASFGGARDSGLAREPTSERAAAPRSRKLRGGDFRGDYIFRPNTWHSIELNVKHNVPEWGNQPVQFALEEDAALLESGWTWIAGPQTQFYLIK